MHQESLPGNNSRRPLFFMSNVCQPCVMCSLILNNWHGCCRARNCRFGFSQTRNPPPPRVSSNFRGWPCVSDAVILHALYVSASLCCLQASPP